MKRFNKLFLLITVFIIILSFSGCDKIHFVTFNAADESDSENVTDQNNKEAPIDGQNKTKDETDPDSLNTTPTDSPAESNIQPVKNTELMIYTVNMDTGEIKPVTALIPEGDEITPELIVSTVVESMEDQSLKVGIDSVTTEDDAVVVSFYSDQPPLKNVGDGIEAAILNAIAQSLMDNLDDYSKVIYRVEGKAYVSDNYELGINEVYLEK